MGTFTRNLAVLGTASGVGKTLITIAICRWLRDHGIDVAPFKAMSMQDGDSFYRTASGGLVHYQQVQQASGAKLEPETHMNPIAVWAHSGQVITAVRGAQNTALARRSAHRRTALFREAIMDSYLSLARRHEFIVIEGCGSPVELNLRRRDLSNLWLTRTLAAPCLLVGSVTHTGVFAALVGTLQLMRPAERALVAGLVVNRYAGDPRGFIAGARILEERTGVECWGTVPDLPGLTALSAVPGSPEQTRGLVGSAELDAEIDRWTGHVDRHLELGRLLR